MSSGCRLNKHAKPFSFKFLLSNIWSQDGDKNSLSYSLSAFWLPFSLSQSHSKLRILNSPQHIFAISNHSRNLNLSWQVFLWLKAFLSDLIGKRGDRKEEGRWEHGGSRREEEGNFVLCFYFEGPCEARCENFSKGWKKDGDYADCLRNRLEPTWEKKCTEEETMSKERVGKEMTDIPQVCGGRWAVKITNSFYSSFQVKLKCE